MKYVCKVRLEVPKYDNLTGAFDGYEQINSGDILSEVCRDNYSKNVVLKSENGVYYRIPDFTLKICFFYENE